MWKPGLAGMAACSAALSRSCSPPEFSAVPGGSPWATGSTRCDHPHHGRRSSALGHRTPRRRRTDCDCGGNTTAPAIGSPGMTLARSILLFVVASLRRNRWGLADLARSSGTPRPAVDRRRCHRSRSVRVRRHPATRRQLRSHPRRLRRHLRRRIPRLGRRRRQIPARPLGHHRRSDLPRRRCRDHVRPTSSRILNRGVITKRSCRHHANRQSREQRSLTVVRRVRVAVAG